MHASGYPYICLVSPHRGLTKLNSITLKLVLVAKQGTYPYKTKLLSIGLKLDCASPSMGLRDAK